MRTSYLRGALLSALIIASSIALAVPLLSASPASAQGLTPHDPIYIDGNENFTQANGVVAGSGTENDPYIIENWAIDASSAHGIRIEDTTAYFILRNCVIENGLCWGGSYYGIIFENVKNGRIENCVSERNILGIFFRHSDNNTLSGNTVKNNRWWGIYLQFSSNNTLKNNILNNNTYNFGVDGSELSHFIHNIDSTNLVNGKPILYLIGGSDIALNQDNQDRLGYLGLVQCNNIRVKNLVFKNNGNGILLAGTENSILENNVYRNNYYGIYLYDSNNNILSGNALGNNFWGGIYLRESDNNILSGNKVENNKADGICLDASDNNVIFRNYILNNSRNAYADHGTNYWDNNGEGNWWSDWQPPEHPDANNDGIVDEPYQIPGGTDVDRYPLVISRTWYVDDDLQDYPNADFTKIQDAIDAAHAGDTIIVYPGTYTENVDVNKDHLTIKSENGAERTIVQAENCDFAFKITKDYMIVNGFTVKGAVPDNWVREGRGAGIVVMGYSCNVSNNVISDRPFAIVSSYSFNIIENNTILYDKDGEGIVLVNAGVTKVKNNKIDFVTESLSSYMKAIVVECGEGNEIVNNSITRAGYGIFIDTTSHNTVKNNSIGYTGDDFSMRNDYGVYVMDGIYLRGSYSNIVTNNAIFPCFHAIYLDDSPDPTWGGLENPNHITGNIVRSNPYVHTVGITLKNSSNNQIYFNGFIVGSDDIAVHSEDSTNTWNSPKKITYTYNGKTYTNYLGNYWSDYTGSDADGDGIGDTPYDIDGDKDNYPLTEPFENYLLTPPPEDQPPVCVIKLQKGGVEINEVDVGEFFDIYVGDSTDDFGIKEVRFSSDDVQDDIPTGEWTQWYNWSVSTGDWNAETKIKRWSFATYGSKEVWVEVKDTGGNDNISHANIFSGWSFAIITDLHIGRGYSDYGGKGVYLSEDSQVEGENYYLTDRLNETVNWIIENRGRFNFKFAVVLGDISDSGEYSELKKAKDILDRLNEADIPYFPVIGNHDVWPYTQEEECTSLRYFEYVFGPQFEKLAQDTRFNFEFQPIRGEFINYRFSYKKLNFVALDFNSREHALTHGAKPEAVLHGITELWLADSLSHYEGKSVVLLSHHPMIRSSALGRIFGEESWLHLKAWISAFSDVDIDLLNSDICSIETNVVANFAGHIHGYYDPYHLLGFFPPINPFFWDANVDYKQKEFYTPDNMSVITTEALMVSSNEPAPATPKGIVRIVKVEGEKIDFNTIDGEFRALNPYLKKIEWFPGFEGIPPKRVWRVRFTFYAFTGLSPLSYTLDFDDGSPKSIVEAFYLGVPPYYLPSEFWHSYPKEGGKYNVELTAKTLVTEENITRTITLPYWSWGILSHSPVHIIVVDPDGLTISKQVNEVEGAYYFETDVDGDGDIDDVITFSTRKIGDYLISIVPEPDASPTDIYTLEILTEDDKILSLAENVKISDIPTKPYIVSSTETEVTVWNYLFKDVERGTKLYINTNSKTFRFTAPDGYDSGVIKAPKMRVIKIDPSKPNKELRYAPKQKTWSINPSGLGLLSDLSPSVISQHQFREKPKEIILILYKDENISFSAVAVNSNVDFCLARLLNKQTKQTYLLIDRPGIDELAMTWGRKIDITWGPPDRKKLFDFRIYP